MVDVNNKKCAHQGCSTTPSFGVAGTKKAEFCREHAKQGMLCLGSSAFPAPHPSVPLTQPSSAVRGGDAGGGYESSGICGRFSTSRRRDQRTPGTQPTGSKVMISKGRVEPASSGDQEAGQRHAPVPMPQGQTAPADRSASAPDSPPAEEESETTSATIKAEEVLIFAGVAGSDDLVGGVPYDKGRYSKRQYKGKGSASPTSAKRRKTSTVLDGIKRTRALDPDSQASAMGGVNGAGPAQAKVEIKPEVDQEHNATVNPAGDWSEAMRE
ncbi:unnamed protein product [Ectocarpus fasciculatus]